MNYSATLLVFAAAIFIIVWFIKDDLNEYETFRKLGDTKARQKTMLVWTLKSFLYFGVGAIVGLAIIGQLWTVLTELPEPFLGTVPDAWPFANDETAEEPSGFWGGMLTSVVPALFLGVLFGPLIRHFVFQKLDNNTTADDHIVGDIEPLFARNKGERLCSIALHANAGFSEELFFRGLMPVLIFMVIGNVYVALISSTIIFGLIHFYQGWAGMIAATALGALMMLVYLATGSIWIAVLIHAINNLQTTIVVPWLSGLRRSDSSEQP